MIINLPLGTKTHLPLPYHKGPLGPLQVQDLTSSIPSKSCSSHYVLFLSDPASWCLRTMYQNTLSFPFILNTWGLCSSTHDPLFPALSVKHSWYNLWWPSSLRMQLTITYSECTIVGHFWEYFTSTILLSVISLKQLKNFWVDSSWNHSGVLNF